MERALDISGEFPGLKPFPSPGEHNHAACDQTKTGLRSGEPSNRSMVPCGHIARLEYVTMKRHHMLWARLESALALMGYGDEDPKGVARRIGLVSRWVA